MLFVSECKVMVSPGSDVMDALIKIEISLLFKKIYEEFIVFYLKMGDSCFDHPKGTTFATLLI
jgi:hypothetical protein